MPEPRYPKNAPGDFHVLDQSRIQCQAPFHKADGLMEHDSEGDYPHCYFKK